MKKINAILVLIFIVVLGILINIYSYKLSVLFFSSLAALEVCSYILVNKLRKNFQWLITLKDEFPELNKNGLKKFMKIGYDPELGWIRKPNMEKEEIGKSGKTKYHIDKIGSRKNPGHEKLSKKISFYGDSFLFSRQVNDNETCQWHLSEIAKTNVLNFAVGNYGLDQALLRLKREYPRNKTKIVVMGVVPSTIVRVLCVWKHYNEFGNIFGFKPRFIIKRGRLKLIRNFIDTEDKFLNYNEYLNKIRKYDYFYKTKFKQEMIQFPYFISILSDPMRNIPIFFFVFISKLFKTEKGIEAYPHAMKVIMKVNLKLRYKLFKENKNAVKLLQKLVEEFANYGKKNKFVPVFLFMPQKDDLLFIRKKGCYYKDFIENIKRELFIIDLTDYLIDREDLDEVYSDDNEYGGHYSDYGNRLIAGFIYKEIKENKII